MNMESYSGKVMELKARLQHSKAKYLEHLLTWHELQEMLNAVCIKKSQASQHLIKFLEFEDRKRREVPAVDRRENVECAELKEQCDKRKKRLSSQSSAICSLECSIAELKSMGLKPGLTDYGNTEPHDLDNLQKEESGLKQECRLLRLQLASCRQKQWYSDITVVQKQSKIDQNTVKKLSPNSPGTQLTTRTHTDQPKLGHRKRFNFKNHSTQNSNSKCPLYSSSRLYEKILSQGAYTDEGSNHQSIDQSIDTLPSMDYEEMDSPELHIDGSLSQFAESQPENSIVPALGMSRRAVMSASGLVPTSPDVMNISQSVDFVEARKKANNRHFKFLCNF